MGYLRFTADDFEIVKNMDLYDLGAVTFWLLNSLNGQEVCLNKIKSGNIVAHLFAKKKNDDYICSVFFMVLDY